MPRLILQLAVVLLALRSVPAVAQGNAPAGTAPFASMLPTRVEFGGYYSWVDRGFGDWRGLNAELWLARNTRFVPGFMVDSQTRPAGTQQHYAFMSYMNWTDSFYTVQGLSGAPQRSAEAIFFPKMRYDIKAYWKLPPEKHFVLGAGYTRFDFGRPGNGHILNVGGLYYRGRWVVEGNLFVNQSRPGNLWSASGSLAVQYGTEGRYWFGATASGGRELYRVDVLTPLDVRLNSFTVDVFYRRWISRHFGFRLAATYLDKLEAYRRAGVSARVFIDF
jgi:YaiO family outer membrane protein